MNTWIEREVPISDVEGLLANGYEIEVDSPDGYVPVNFFIDKGTFQEYVLEMEDPYYDNVLCNADHLFETTLGWAAAGTLANSGSVNILTRDGYKLGRVSITDQQIPIVDINVEHDNHRYYTNGVSSHNTGVGKSLFMCHVGAAALTQGKSVLYITMEMAEERIAERIDANLLDVPIDQLENLSQDAFTDRVHRLSKRTEGKLIIKEYPTGQANTSHFRALLSELKLKKSFTPDLILIDYLNICSSARMKSMGGSINSYTYIKSIIEEIRGLAVEFDVPIVTATQTTRTGYSNSDVSIEDVSESFGVSHTADLMFALISSEELESMGQLAVKQLKNRYNDVSYKKRFVLGVDRSKMRLFDVGDEEQNLIDDTPIFDKSEMTDRFKEFKL
jgi:hypothetical protein